MKTPRILLVTTVVAVLCAFLGNSVRAQSVSLADAVDAPQLTWTTGGNATWIGQTNTTFDGVDAAQSGVIGNSQESWLETTVTGPGELTFRWKVSSESDWDYLEFSLNGVLQSGRISGNVDWQPKTYNLVTGNQTLRWRYVKDNSESFGEDRGWVDVVSFAEASGPPVIQIQPQSQTVTEGANVTFDVVASGEPPLFYQWFRDTTPLDGANNSSYGILNVQTNHMASYTVVVTNTLGSITSAPVVLVVNVPLLDADFVAGVTGFGFASVYALAVQADGKILVGGTFTTLGGQSRNNIGRLHPNGDLDTSFNPGVNGPVSALAVQADGKILVGGDFTTLTGQGRNRLGRLNPNGTLDITFNPGAGGPVYALAMQADGKILVGGDFTTLGGQGRNRLGRLNPDGTVDSTLNSGAGGFVNTLAVQADGKILVGGDFTTLAGAARNRLARLNANGSLDTAFNPGASGGAFSVVSSLAVQADGKVVVGGEFATLGGQSRANIGRLNTNGTVDVTFNPGADGAVAALGVQTDGKIVVGGNFMHLGGHQRERIGRINADGTLDNTLNPGADNLVDSLAVQPDGKILVGGWFATLEGQPRSSLGRLKSTDPATESLTHADSTITWLRGGTSPEVVHTAFDVGANDVPWTNLGGGTRIAGGWEKSSVPVSADQTIRVRGYSAGAAGSSWFLESYFGRPVFVEQPVSRTNDYGTIAVFEISGVGSEPLSFQWLKNGIALTDQGNLTGATNRVLMFGQVSGDDEASYSVILSNSFGSVTSLVVTLTVHDPYITQQPFDEDRNAGDDVSFWVNAEGTPPLSYQWFHDGIELPEATSQFLTLPEITKTNAGLYYAVITNVFGSVTSSMVTLTVHDPFITQNPGSVRRNVGESVTLEVEAGGTPPLSYQWHLNGTMIPNATNKSLALLNLSAFDAGVYTFVVSNASGSITSAPAALTVNAVTLDHALSIGLGGLVREVHSMAVQPDGRILIGGDFDSLAGQSRTNLGRLNADGTLDNTFNPVTDQFGDVFCLALQPDGRILLGGNFNTLGGQARTSVGRLNPDGTLDASFSPGVAGGFRPPVRCLAIQPDGKIVVGGSFSSLGGQSRTNLGRLNSDGTLDASFNTGAAGVFGDSVHCLALQPDGKIVVGGSFEVLGGQSRTNIGRLNSDGTLDATFDPQANGTVFSLALQPDGKILLAGSFYMLGGQPRLNIARVRADGTLDAAFSPELDATVNSLTLQADGKILAGGYFYLVNEQVQPYLARFQTDGSLDFTFNPEPNSFVTRLTLQPDGKILAGGNFTGLLGQQRNRIARLNNTESATQSLDRAGSTMTWLRGGTSPEFWRTTFDYSVDGSAWTSLGTGTGINGGWQLTGALLPANVTLRGRGHVSGDDKGSGWYVEDYQGKPVMISQPASRTNNFGTTANFFTAAGGSEPVSYQWRKDGVALGNTGNISGANSPNLTVTGLSKADEGSYTLVASNSFGSVNSVVATLVVLDPYIVQQPVGGDLNTGTNVTFQVTANGTPPLSYSWYRNGAAMTDATNSSLTLSNLSQADAGLYTVVVSGPNGNITSMPALLTVRAPLFVNPTPGAADGFGQAVAALGIDRVIIGAPDDNAGATEAGAVYLFSTNRVLLTTITNPTPALAGC